MTASVWWSEDSVTDQDFPNLNPGLGPHFLLGGLWQVVPAQPQSSPSAKGDTLHAQVLVFYTLFLLTSLAKGCLFFLCICS